MAAIGGRTIWRGLIAALARGFEFAPRQPLLPFALAAAKFAAVFALAWGIERSGILAPGIARQGELVTALAILCFFPVLALMTRRLNDTAMPSLVLYLAPLLYGLASAAAVMFRLPELGAALRWLGHGAAVLTLIGLVLPSKREAGR